MGEKNIKKITNYQFDNQTFKNNYFEMYFLINFQTIDCQKFVALKKI